MKSKMSFFNAGLIISNIKQFWCVSALYLVGLTIIFPLIILQSASNIFSNNETIYVDRLNDIANGFLFIIPILFGVLLFSYQNKPKEVTMLHALPFSRTIIFINQSISGLILMFTPVIMNGIVLIILNLTTSLNQIYTISQVLVVTGMIMLFQILIYSSSIFIGMLTGNSIAHFISTYIFHLIPIGIYFAITSFISSIQIGFTNLDNYFFNNIILNTPLLKGIFIYKTYNSDYSSIIEYNGAIPFFQPLSGYVVGLNTSQLVIYIIATVVFLVVSLLLYKKKNFETATDIISFNVFRPIFKYIITFSTMLIGSIYIMGILKYTPSIPSLLIWSFIGYCITEIIIQKSFKIWNSYKGFIIYSAIIVTLFLIISNDVIGFVDKVPNPNDVEIAYFGDKSNFDEHKFDITAKIATIDSNYYVGTNISEINNIEDVHKRLIDENKRIPYNIYQLSTNYNQYYIKYILKNGSQLVRCYSSKINYLNKSKIIYE